MSAEEEECPACGERVPAAARANHEAGRDARRPGCPLQDLEAIREHQSSPNAEYRRFLYER